MKWFTGVWYVLMLIYLIGGSGMGTLRHAWVLFLPVAYWFAKFWLDRTHKHIWDAAALALAQAMALYLVLASVDTALSVPALGVVRYL